MIDTHCHIDLYPNPSEVVSKAERAGVTTIVVTNLPSAFSKAYPHLRELQRTRLALGMHPLLAEEHDRERKLFEELVDKTSYIGEIGLDFSRAGHFTKEIQIESFRLILEALRGKPKFITLHSRQAEPTVLDWLEKYNCSPVVFHWYNGSLTSLDRALKDGHYFSVNIAMLNSQKGQRIIAKLPSDRVLTETDGPFIKAGSRPLYPQDIAAVQERLAALWQISTDEASAIVKRNFLELVRPLRIRNFDSLT